MPEHHAYALICAPDELNALGQAMGMLKHIIAERRLVSDPETDLLVQHYTPDTILASWDEGRAFGTTYQIQWVRRRDEFDVVVLGELTRPPASGQLQADESLGAYNIHEDSVLLWGILDADDPSMWWETRIPRNLNYPLSIPDDKRHQPNIRPRLHIVEYQHPETAAIHWWRCTGLSWAEENMYAKSV